MTLPDPNSDPDPLRSRQKSRARVMGIALGAFVILMFLISIAKMSVSS